MKAVLIVLGIIAFIVVVDLTNDHQIRKQGGIPPPHIWEVKTKEIFKTK